MCHAAFPSGVASRSTMWKQAACREEGVIDTECLPRRLARVLPFRPELVMLAAFSLKFALETLRGIAPLKILCMICLIDKLALCSPRVLYRHSADLDVT